MVTPEEVAQLARELGRLDEHERFDRSPDLVLQWLKSAEALCLIDDVAWWLLLLECVAHGLHVAGIDARLREFILLEMARLGGAAREWGGGAQFRLEASAQEFLDWFRYEEVGRPDDYSIDDRGDGRFSIRKRPRGGGVGRVLDDVMQLIHAEHESPYYVPNAEVLDFFPDWRNYFRGPAYLMEVAPLGTKRSILSSWLMGSATMADREEYYSFVERTRRFLAPEAGGVLQVPDREGPARFIGARLGRPWKEALTIADFAQHPLRPLSAEEVAALAPQPPAMDSDGHATGGEGEGHESADDDGSGARHRPTLETQERAKLYERLERVRYFGVSVVGSGHEQKRVSQ